MAEPITIQRLGPEDLDLLLSVNDEIFDHPIRPDQAKRFLDEDTHEIAIAFQDGHAVGKITGVVMFHPDKAPQMFINEVDVAETHRNRGIGRALMQCMLDIAVQRGCDCAWLGTELDNAPARALYRGLKPDESPNLVLYTWDDLDDRN